MKLLLIPLLCLTLLTTDDDAAKRRSALDLQPESTIVLQVADLDASLAWYRRVLGFEKKFVLETMRFGEVTTSVPGLAIGFAQMEEPKASIGAVGIGVKDMRTALAGLAAEEVEPYETQDIPDVVKLAWFKDPDGNTLFFHESLME